MEPDKPALRRALLSRCAWLGSTDLGPQSVEAGECDACGAEARLVQTCGPQSATYLGRRCAADAGVEAWCSGHVAEADAALRWLADLPPEADDVARLWWVATGEVRLDPHLARRMRELGAASWPV